MFDEVAFFKTLVRLHPFWDYKVNVICTSNNFVNTLTFDNILKNCVRSGGSVVKSIGQYLFTHAENKPTGFNFLSEPEAIQFKKE